MSDLISKSALIEAFEPDHDCDWYTPDIIKKIEEQSTAEPVRGEWEYTPTYGEYECSICKSMISLSDDANAHPNFCPNCGADMKKKVEE